MASFTPGNGKAQTNGTTSVSLVAAPSSGWRIVRSVSLHNADTVTRTLSLVVDDGTEYTIADFTLAASETATFDAPINLGTGDTLEVVSDAAATTTEPFAFASFADVA
jgi:hypothetical protein